MPVNPTAAAPVATKADNAVSVSEVAAATSGVPRRLSEATQAVRALHDLVEEVANGTLPPLMPQSTEHGAFWSVAMVRNAVSTSDDKP